MTDKEQIIIDGVDVRTCDSFIDYYMVDETRFQDVPEDIIEQDKLPVVYKGLPDCLLRKNLCNAHICHCKDKPNCCFKQLARKTQEYEQKEKELLNVEKARKELVDRVIMLVYECEELKERLVRTEEDLKYQCVDCMNCQSDRYRKALEEIEEYVRDNSDFDKSDILTSKTGAYDILNIINKAKE